MLNSIVSEPFVLIWTLGLIKA